MNATASRPARLQARLGVALAAALSATVLAGCGSANAPGRPQPSRPESSYAKTPGTPRGAGTPSRTGVPQPGLNTKGGQSPGRTTSGAKGSGKRKSAPTNKHMTSSGTPTTRPGTGGLVGTATGLFGWGLGRPPGGLGGGLRGGVAGRPKAGRPAHTTTGKPATTRPKSGLRKGAGTGKGASKATTGGAKGTPSKSTAGASPYADVRTRAHADRLGGAHRGHAGTFTPPSAHRVGQPLSSSASLATLPAWTSLIHYNGYLVSYSHLTPWVANMGVHWGPRGPGLVLMQNGNRDVTAVETSFPAQKGWQPWFDQPKAAPAGTIYSEHLYFAAPTSITTTMSKSVPSDLTSWQAFSTVNAAKTSHYKPVGTDPSGRATQYGPPAEGIRVLVDSQGHVVGLMGAWPSNSPQGWRPWFDQRQGASIQDPILGSVYTQHLWLVDPRSLPPATKSS